MGKSSTDLAAATRMVLHSCDGPFVTRKSLIEIFDQRTTDEAMRHFGERTEQRVPNPAPLSNDIPAAQVLVYDGLMRGFNLLKITDDLSRRFTQESVVTALVQGVAQFGKTGYAKVLEQAFAPKPSAGPTA